MSIRAPSHFWRRAGGSVLLALTLCTLLLLINRADTLTQPPAAHAAPEAPGRISGRVTDEQGQPIANANVVLVGYPAPDQIYINPGGDNLSSTTAKTDSSGYYTFPIVTSGIYRVGFFTEDQLYGRQFYSATHYGNATELTVMGDVHDHIDTVLQPAGAINVSVATTLPLPYSFAINNLAISIYREHNNQWFADEVYQFFPQFGAPPSLNMLSVRGLLPGVYRLCVSANYSYYFSAQLLGCFGASTDFEGNTPPVEAATNITVTSGLTITGVHIPLSVIFTNDYSIPTDVPGIAGKVTNQSGEPIPGIFVSALYTDFLGLSSIANTSTNLNGEYFLKLNADGNYLVRFQSDGVYVQQFYDQLDLFEDLWVFPAPELSRAKVVTWKVGQRLNGIDAKLSRTASIAGRVTLYDGVTPVRSAGLAIHRVLSGTGIVYRSYNPEFSANGEYQITGMPPGVYRVSANAYLNYGYISDWIDGYYGGTTLENAAEITVGIAEQKSGININVGEGQFEGTIAGTVMGGGSPLAGIRVDLFRHTGSNPLFVQTDASGHYTFSGLLNGGHYLRFSDDAQKYAAVYHDGKTYLNFAQPLTITGKTELTNINIDLVPGGEINGTLRDKTGQPLANVNVSLNWYDSLKNEEVGITGYFTEQDGAFRFKALMPGVYRVYFGRSDFLSNIPYGTFDSQSGVYVPTNINLSSGQRFVADMILAAPTGLDGNEEPADQRVIYLPVAARE